MMRATAMIAVLFAAAALISCATYRNTFKLTIEVEVDGERRIASSVYEREIYDNIGGVADRTRGTMPHMSLGRHGDIVLSFGYSHGQFIGNRSWLAASRPIYVKRKMTWFFPAFDQGQTQPSKDVLYPARGGDAVVVPVGKLLTLPVIWRPPGETDITRFKKTWFHYLAESIAPAVRPVRITIEPTSEPLLYFIPDAPEWIRDWRRQYERLPEDIRVPASATTYFQRRHFSISQFETERGS